MEQLKDQIIAAGGRLWEKGSHSRVYMSESQLAGLAAGAGLTQNQHRALTRNSYVYLDLHTGRLVSRFAEQVPARGLRTIRENLSQLEGA